MFKTCLGSSEWPLLRSQTPATAARDPPDCSPWTPSPMPASSSARSEWPALMENRANLLRYAPPKYIQEINFPHLLCDTQYRKRFTCLLYKYRWGSEQLCRSSWHCFWSLGHKQTPAWCAKGFPPLFHHPWNTRTKESIYCIYHRYYNNNTFYSKLPFSAFKSLLIPIIHSDSTLSKWCSVAYSHNPALPWSHSKPCQAPKRKMQMWGGCRAEYQNTSSGHAVICAYRPTDTRRSLYYCCRRKSILIHFKQSSLLFLYFFHLPASQISYSKLGVIWVYWVYNHGYL